MNSPNSQGDYEHAAEVDHPSHYQTASGLEVADVLEAFELNWHFAFATKHILRAGKKPGQPADRDVEKAIWYLRRWLETQRPEVGVSPRTDPKNFHMHFCEPCRLTIPHIGAEPPEVRVCPKCGFPAPLRKSEGNECST